MSPVAISSSGTSSGLNSALVIHAQRLLVGRAFTMMSPLSGAQKKPCQPVVSSLPLPAPPTLTEASGRRGSGGQALAEGHGHRLQPVGGRRNSVVGHLRLGRRTWLEPRWCRGTHGHGGHREAGTRWGTRGRQGTQVRPWATGGRHCMQDVFVRDFQGPKNLFSRTPSNA